MADIKALLITTNKNNSIYKYNIVERNGELRRLGKALWSRNVTPESLDFDILEGSILKVKISGDYVPSGERVEYMPGKSHKISEAIVYADKFKIENIYMYDEAIESWTYYSRRNNSWDLVSSYIKDPRFRPEDVQIRNTF